MEQSNRQLAAILFTDIVGYTSMMQQDEQNAVTVTRHYISVLKESVAAHHGKILNDYGDGSLCSFSSATEGMRCAIEMQQQLQQEPRVPLRMGLHVGELFFEGDKVMGDGVNIASRIQSLGQANTILFSKEVYDNLKNQPEFKSVSVGRFQFKSIDELMEVFALANEGLVIPDRKKMEGKLQEKKYSSKKIILAGILLLLVIVSFFLNRPSAKDSGFTGKEKSIAVLPFESISSEKENEYINDGFTIDIINKLSKVSGLKEVPQWARVKVFKNTNKALKEIADELGVAAILTGTIQKQADRLHVTASLFDVNSGKTIWDEDDDKKWGDILNLQSEVAQKIVSSLSAQITPEEKRGINKQYTDNAEAYKYYIKGRYFWDKRTLVSFDSAEANYKKAIELDPKYALAYAGLADCFIFNQKGLTQLEAIPVARDYARKALSLDSNLADAITTMGFIQSAFDYEWNKARLTLEKAIRLNPNYTYAHIFYGNLLQYSGTNEEKGLAEIEKARELEPSSASINWIVGRNYYLAGKNDTAEMELRKTITKNPQYDIAKAYLAMTLLAKREFEKAFEIIRQIPRSGISKNGEYQGALLSYAYGLSGEITRAKEELANTLNEPGFHSHYPIARAYMGIKDYSQVIVELEKSLAIKEIHLYFLKVDPVFAPLKNEPRFKTILKKMNLN